VNGKHLPQLNINCPKHIITISNTVDSCEYGQAKSVLRWSRWHNFPSARKLPSGILQLSARSTLELLSQHSGILQRIPSELNLGVEPDWRITQAPQRLRQGDDLFAESRLDSRLLRAEANCRKDD